MKRKVAITMIEGVQGVIIITIKINTIIGAEAEVKEDIMTKEVEAGVEKEIEIQAEVKAEATIIIDIKEIRIMIDIEDKIGRKGIGIIMTRERMKREEIDLRKEKNKLK